MNYAVLDTDIASLIFRDRLPPTMGTRLVGKIWCVSFVTVAEMTQWARLRDWAPHNQAALDRWLSAQVFLDCGVETARTWGTCRPTERDAVALIRSTTRGLLHAASAKGFRWRPLT
jgi:predicted nucleic acid-binding protein